MIRKAYFARELKRLEVIRNLHAAYVEAGNGKTLDLKLSLNWIGGIFEPEKEAQEYKF